MSFSFRHSESFSQRDESGHGSERWLGATSRDSFACVEPEPSDGRILSLGAPIDLGIPATTKRNKKVTLVKRIFGIGPEYGDMPASKLIYPLSPFGVAWLASTAILLVYTAIVTPPVIAFHWLDEDCVTLPTLPIDIDVIYNFNTGVMGPGEYIDDRLLVMKTYLKGSFMFDICTSIPVSFIELAAAAACETGEGGGVAGQQVRLIRAMKPFKIARLLKLGKSAAVITVLMDYYEISPKQGKTLQVMASLVGVVHIFGCIIWLGKVVGAGTDPKQEIELFLETIPWGSTGEPADLSTASGKLEAYVISIYLAAMTLTTVGYGDITPVNTFERVGFTLLFVVGAFVWGTLLAEVGEVHRAGSIKKSKQRDQVQGTLDFLIDNEVPKSLRGAIIQWTRFQQEHEAVASTKKEMIKELPSKLQRQLVVHLYAHAVMRVPLFQYLHDIDMFEGGPKSDILSELCLLLDYATYTPGTAIIDSGQPADKLVIFVGGKVLVEFGFDPFQQALLGSDSMTGEDADDITMAKQGEIVHLKVGDFIGDGSLLGDEDWGSSTLLSNPRNSPGSIQNTVKIGGVHVGKRWAAEMETQLELLAEEYDSPSSSPVPVLDNELSARIKKEKDFLKSKDPQSSIKRRGSALWRSHVVDVNSEVKELQNPAPRVDYDMFVSLAGKAWEAAKISYPDDEPSAWGNIPAKKSAMENVSNVYEGIVRKRGQINPDFKPRQFQLSEGMLRYFEIVESTFSEQLVEKGSLGCKGMVVTLPTEEKPTEHGFAFTIISAHGKKIECAVDNARERDQWVEKLRQAIAIANGSTNEDGFSSSPPGDRAAPPVLSGKIAAEFNVNRIDSPASVIPAKTPDAPPWVSVPGQNPVKNARRIFNGLDMKRAGSLDLHHLITTCAAMAKHEVREVKVTAHPSTFVVCLFLQADRFREFAETKAAFTVMSAIQRFKTQWHKTTRHNCLANVNDRYRFKEAAAWAMISHRLLSKYNASDVPGHQLAEPNGAVQHDRGRRDSSGMNTIGEGSEAEEHHDQTKTSDLAEDMSRNLAFNIKAAHDKIKRFQEKGNLPNNLWRSEISVIENADNQQALVAGRQVPPPLDIPSPRQLTADAQPDSMAQAFADISVEQPPDEPSLNRQVLFSDTVHVSGNTAFLPEPSGLQGSHVGDKRRLVQREGQPALHGAGNLESQVQELVASHQKLQEMQSQLLALATANATSQKQTQQQLNQLFKHLGVVQAPGATGVQEQGADAEGRGAFRGDGSGMLDGGSSGVCDSSAATLTWRHKGSQNGLSPERPLYASNVSVSGVHRLYLPRKEGTSE